MAESTGRLRLPGKLDPGWATLGAAVLAVVGTFATVIASCDPRSPSSVAPASVTSPDTSITAHTATSSPTVTSTLAPPSTASTSTTSSTSSSTTVESPPASTTPAPTVNVIAALGAAGQDAIRAVANELLAAARQLPLMVKDEFENNDYQWGVGSRIFDGGVECKWEIAESVLATTISSVQGAAMCYTLNPSTARDFVVSVALDLRSDRLADISMYYRAAPDLSDGYQVTMTPHTQHLGVAVVLDGVLTPLLAPTFVEQLSATDANVLSVVVLADSQMIYVNGALVASISNEVRVPDAGIVALKVELKEPNQVETLVADDFEMRGA